MRVLYWTLAAAVAVAAAPQPGLAQNRDRDDRIRDVRRGQQEVRQRARDGRAAATQPARADTYERGRRADGDRSIADILRERRDRRERNRDEDWRRADDWGVEARGGNGPAFCRSGQGHPVHGWQWCRDKGWSGDYDRLGRYDRRDDVLRRAPLPARERERRLEVLGRARGTTGPIR